MKVFEKAERTLLRNINSIRGWRSKNKYIVFESDDWGGIRMPSKNVFNVLLRSGVNVDKCNFLKYDTIADYDDLEGLFNILLSFKDKLGKNPVFTANTIVANPDFELIEKSGFKEYFYEEFTKSLSRYYNDNVFKKWISGIDCGVFYPQLHGREHLNIIRWMNFLQMGSNETQLAFKHGLFGISTNVTKEKRGSFMAAFDADKIEDIESYRNILIDSQNIFKKVFGYKSESFIAPNYVWPKKMEVYLNEIGIKYIQGSKVQISPLSSKRYILHYTGERNSLNQIYLVRNCSFEPTFESNSVNKCLSQIRTSFLLRKPAIISTHRVNYIGRIEEQNRFRSIRELSDLLKKILKLWPDVQFVTSPQLGKIIKSENESINNR